MADSKKQQKGFRSSISAYIEMERRHIFGMVFTIAAMLFIYNGVINLDVSFQEQMYQFDFWQERGYNIVLGTVLFGVLLFPYNVYPKTHYTFAFLFFIGCTLVIAFIHDKEDTVISYIIAAASILALVAHLINKKWINLFWAEWIALTVIGIHFILEAKDIISFAS
nr:hypothetical protein [Allomuricauda lutimaris]